MEEHRGLWASSKQIPAIKKELRALVPPLSYIDVRRQRLSIYDAISRELLEDGCTECAEHFERLSNMENYLFEMRIIKIRIYETKGLLGAIIDNVRIAERNCKILHNHGLALRTLFQTAMLLDRREGNEYNWLTKEMYLIVNHFIDLWSKRWKFPESECRSRYYFGKYLLIKDHNYADAIEQLKIALDLAKCKLWYTAKETYNYLSMKTRVYLCKAYLCEADRIQKKDKVLAEELATHAIMAVWEGRLPKDIKLYCEASLRKGFYSIRLKNFQNTLSLYKKVQPYIYSMMLPELKCEMLLHQGICHLNLGNDSLALRKLKQSIRLGEIYNLKTFHAHALVQIGKLYSNSHSTYKLSHKSFEDARNLYLELNDDNNVKKVNYLAAKLKSQQILPQLINLIYDADNKFCDLLTLRAWKDQLEIFWQDDDISVPEDPGDGGITDDEIEFRKGIDENQNKDQNEIDKEDIVLEQIEDIIETEIVKNISQDEIPKEVLDPEKDDDEKLTNQNNENIEQNEEETEKETNKSLDDDDDDEHDDEHDDNDSVDSNSSHKCIFKRMP